MNIKFLLLCLSCFRHLCFKLDARIAPFIVYVNSISVIFHLVLCFSAIFHKFISVFMCIYDGFLFIPASVLYIFYNRRYFIFYTDFLFFDFFLIFRFFYTFDYFFFFWSLFIASWNVLWYYVCIDSAFSRPCRQEP